jgi:hypothetical protein
MIRTKKTGILSENSFPIKILKLNRLFTELLTKHLANESNSQQRSLTT